MANSLQSSDNHQLWDQFSTHAALTPQQLELFKRYAELLSFWSDRINLTAITADPDIVEYHFKDSLALGKLVDLSAINSLADVGTGAGFPGIALAIKYPHLSVTLIEVNAKKINFLDTVITELELADRVSVFDQDWRTFLRSTQEDIQLFCARASLQPEELCRMFKPGSYYNQSQLVYWASAAWVADDKVAPFVIRELSYHVGNRDRKLILLGNEDKQ